MIVLLSVLGCEPTEYATGPQVWSEPTDHANEDFLFDHTRINRIDLTLGPTQEEILRAERTLTSPRNEVHGLATIDGEDLGEIGIRLRGGLGSFQRYDDKPKWELDFNEVTGERFHGLESLSLNNGTSECAGARDHMGFFINGLAGVPTSRTGNVQLFVNGLDYGVYIALETQDDRWLKRTFSNNDGNFYDGGYVQAGPWPVFLDFDRGRDHLFDLEEGTDNGFIDIATISTELARSQENGSATQAIWALIDWDVILRKFAVEEWTGNGDAYLTLANNYRVYFQTDGPMVMAPWDQDNSFPYQEDDEDSEDEEDGRSSYRDSRSALAVVCATDTNCLARWRQTARDVADTLDGPEPLAFVENLIAVTREGLDEHPREDCTVQERNQERDQLLQWIEVASADLRAAWP
jgi:spore coat protein CotH